MGDTTRKRTSLFLCRCGPNIGELLDLDALAAWAGEHGGIDHVEIHDLLCAPMGKQAFEASLEAHRPERVIVAACSPKMHEATFQGLAEKASLNPGHVRMANVREQCAWVTKDRGRATEKAQRLIEAAVRRASLADELERRTTEVRTDVLIIGGGLAGIEAALTAAQAGRKVYLVEREISLGGAVIQTEEIAPAMECSPCVLAPRLAAVKDHPNIEVFTNAEVTAVLGFAGNFTARVTKHARYVKDNCIGCEACFEVCPVEVDSRFHLGLGKWKAVHTLFPGSVPAAAAIDTDACLHFTDGSCSACVPECPFESIDFDQQDEHFEIDIGAVVLATGFAPYDISGFEALGHRKLEEVYTLSELERLASSNGPTGGEIRKRDGSAPRSIAVVHCAGSMRADGLPYCSGVCCQNAVKVGVLARLKDPDVVVHNIHRDLVFAGPKAARFLADARAGGTRFHHCEALDTVRVSKQNGGLRVEANGLDPLDVDMVVLANGMAPAAGVAQMAEMLDLARDRDGYFRADHDVLHATGSALDGVYLAGAAAGPCDVATAITRARSAVGDALARYVPGREIELETLTAYIDADQCGGCKLCITVCPYKAVDFDAEAGVSRINEAICRGCGTCAAACPTGASHARQYTDEQIYAEIGGLVNHG